MNEDKIIADYIRDRFPQMLNTSDFAMYKFCQQLGNATNSFVVGLKSAFNSLTPEQEQLILDKCEEVRNEVDSEENN